MIHKVTCTAVSHYMPSSCLPKRGEFLRSFLYFPSLALWDEAEGLEDAGWRTACQSHPWAVSWLIKTMCAGRKRVNCAHPQLQIQSRGQLSGCELGVVRNISPQADSYWSLQAFTSILHSLLMGWHTALASPKLQRHFLRDVLMWLYTCYVTIGYSVPHT